MHVGRSVGRSFRILLPCQERPTTPKPSLRFPVAASAWSPGTAKLGRLTALSRSPGADRGGRRTAAATGSRPAKATDRPRTRAAAPPPSLAAGRRGGHRGAGTPGRLATRPHRPRARRSPFVGEHLGVSPSDTDTLEDLRAETAIPASQIITNSSVRAEQYGVVGIYHIER
jgi:hypothetical protein